MTKLTPCQRPVRTLLEQLQVGDLSSTRLTEECLHEIKSQNGSLNAFLTLQEESAIRQAEAIDQRRARGESLGLLAGLPIAIKDNICQLDTKTTCSSRMLENFVSPYDAHVIEKLQQADAIIIGKTNLDEFAMGSSTENSYFGMSRNPWNPEFVPGGSSGGSASAVAANMAPLALGSDTGGSIRQPAAFCGLVGLKPTYGRVSRYGLVAFASSLDQIGPFSCDVYGSAILMDAISGHDQRDSTSLPYPALELTKDLDQPITGLKIGVIEELMEKSVDGDIVAGVRHAIDVYRQQGAEIIPIKLPHAEYAVATYYIIAPCEASSNLSRYDGIHYGYRAKEFSSLTEMYSRSRGEGFGTEVKRRIMLGTYALSSGYYDAYYNKALKVRRLIRQDYDEAFKNVDVVLGPVTPSAAFKKGEHSQDPLTMYLSDLFTISANLTGLPAISVPCGLNEKGLPLGFQLTGKALEESTLLRIARMFEAQGDWKTNRF